MNLLQFLLDRPWNQARAPDRVLDAPGIISTEECALLYFLARDYYKGVGSIVDLGCFLGRSTNSLAQGLLENSLIEKKLGKVYSYDKFTISAANPEKYLEDIIAKSARDDAKDLTGPEGLRFRPIFDRTIASFRNLVNVHEGEFPPLPYDGGPIEILFVDIAKTEALNNAIVKTMFPRLIPGRSIVVHQDFHHIYSWHIHFCMDFFAEYFRIVVDSVGPSCVFLLVDEIPEGKIADFTGQALATRYPLDEGLQSLSRMQSRLLPPYRSYIELNKIRWRMQFGLDVSDSARRAKSLPLEAANLDAPWEWWVDMVIDEVKRSTLKVRPPR